MVTTFDETKHPRWPKGSPGKGGKFMDKPQAGPFKFLLPHKQEQWGADNFGEWRDSLSEVELNAFRAYAGGRAHEQINSELRGSQGDTDKLSERTRFDVEDMDSALERSEVPEDVKVYRMLSDPAMLDAHDSGNLVGETFIDDGYTSTTINPSFLKEVAQDIEGQLIEATINLPKGTRGAYLGDASMNPEERELLIRRGTAFQVSSATEAKLPNGQMGLRVTLDVLGQYEV